MSQRRNLLSVLRFAGVVIYGYSIYFQQVNPNPLSVKPLGKLKYLTYWDLLLQFGFFSLVFLSQSVLNIKSKKLTKVIDLVFYALAFPVSIMVASTFWSLYAIDREVIFPKAIEPFYPPWLNHSTHTLVAVLSIVELVLAKHKLPSNKDGLTVLNVFMLSYLSVVLYLAFAHNIWVYPFLALLTWPQRIVFFVSNALFNFVFYYIGVWASGKCNNSRSKVKSK